MTPTFMSEQETFEGILFPIYVLFVFQIKPKNISIFLRHLNVSHDVYFEITSTSFSVTLSEDLNFYGLLTFLTKIQIVNYILFKILVEIEKSLKLSKTTQNFKFE